VRVVTPLSIEKQKRSRKHENPKAGKKGVG
jgi:hypothetical protein